MLDCKLQKKRKANRKKAELRRQLAYISDSDEEEAVIPQIKKRKYEKVLPKTSKVTKIQPAKTNEKTEEADLLARLEAIREKKRMSGSHSF